MLSLIHLTVKGVPYLAPQQQSILSLIILVVITQPGDTNTKKNCGRSFIIALFFPAGLLIWTSFRDNGSIKSLGAYYVILNKIKQGDMDGWVSSLSILKIN